MRLRIPEKQKPKLFYLAAALLIFLPLLTTGYILILDMVFAPHMPMPTEIINTYPFYALLHILNVVIPSFVLQKILLIGIFMLSGYGAFKLLQSIQIPTINPKIWLGASYFAGLFYMYNPFTYTRLMAGQYLVLFGYALLPFFILTLWRFLQKPSKRDVLAVVGFTTAIAVTSIHTLGIAILFALIAAIVQICSRSGRRQLKATLRYGLLGLLTVFVLNSFWLLPILRGNSALTNTVHNFSSSDFDAFATVPGEFGTAVQILTLQGFWGDNRNLYLLPQDISALWMIPIAMLWALVLLGSIWSWRNQRKLGGIFAIAGLIGFVLACGVHGSIFAGINEWLGAHVALFAGYREPQKFAMLVVAAYAYFGAVGIAWLLSHLTQLRQRQVALAIVLLLPLACAPLLPWGAANQLRAKSYPADWYTINAQLQETAPRDAEALFLPWHLYMPLSFSSGTVANPAATFFDISIISSNNPELGDAAPYKTKPDVAAVNQLIRNAPSNPSFVPKLAELGIRYIIVAKEYDYAKFDFLKSDINLQQIGHHESLIIYKIDVKSDKTGT